MKKALAVAVVTAWVLPGQASSADAPVFKEGEWSTRFRMETIGRPIPIPPITAKKTLCLGPDRYIPDTAQPDQKCAVSDTTVNGNIVSWTLRCHTPQGTIEGRGTVTYKNETYDGAMDAELVPSVGASPHSRYRYVMSGERKGACPR